MHCEATYITQMYAEALGGTQCAVQSTYFALEDLRAKSGLLLL